MKLVITPAMIIDLMDSIKLMKEDYIGFSKEPQKPTYKLIHYRLLPAVLSNKAYDLYELWLKDFLTINDFITLIEEINNKGKVDLDKILLYEIINSMRTEYASDNLFYVERNTTFFILRKILLSILDISFFDMVINYIEDPSYINIVNVCEVIYDYYFNQED